MEILQNLFRTLMFCIDNIIYGLIPQIYRLFIYLSEINLFSDNPDSPINKLVSHIYVLLGIFMLFKVSFSLLQYIVDPNAFRDSSKGMGKLITNVLVALVLLVSVPSIFSLAMDIQSEIVQSNAIGQLILGTDTGSGNYPVSADGSISDEGVQQMAKDLQFMLYGAFYSVNQDVMKSGRILEGCSGSSGVLGSMDMATENCLNSLQDNLPNDAASNGVSLYSFFKHVDENGNVVDEREFGHLDKLLWWKDDGDYVINYLPIISAAAGIYVIFLLIGFCVDIAVRAIKLCFLQMIAPIAIVSYVDPKESISNGKLNSWIKECASTYFSLFLRLATIFLVMFLISMIASTLLSGGEYISGLPEDNSYNIWIYLFLVIGAFMFAKQVPNIIESIFGIKFSGELHLNPFKNAGAAGILGGVAGFGAGAIASGIAAGKTSLDSGENKFTAFRRTLGGAASGGLRGGVSGAFAGGKGVFNKAFNVAGDISRNTAMKANTKFPYRVGAYVRNAIGAQSLRETLDQKAAIFENYEKSAGNMEARARDQLGKKYDEWKLVQGLRAQNEQQFAQGHISEKQYKDNLNSYWSREQEMIDKYINNNGNMGTKGLDSEDIDLKLEKENFVRNIKENGLNGMSALKDAKDDNGKLIKDIVIEQVNSNKDIKWSDIDTIKKAGHTEAVKIKNSDKYEDAGNAEKAKLSDLRQSFLNK